jgi:pimeloyl-ACP methyl ester carboxylesterase
VKSLLATRARRLLALALCAAAAAGALPFVLSQQLLWTLRQPTSPAPPPWREIGLDSGGLRLRAWLAAGDPARPAVVFVHGHSDSLESQRGPGERLLRLGHTVLLVDLRAHGGSAGRYTTLGGLERDDVRAGLAELRRRGLGASGFALVGCSMGAVSVLRAAAEEADVRAVVAEAPYDDYRSTIHHHARLYVPLPEWLPVVDAAIAAAEWRAGFRAADVSAVEAARRMRSRLLLILDENDPRMPEPVVRRVLDAHPGPKRLWIARGAGHAEGARAPGYWDTVLAFLAEDDAQGPPSDSGASR